MKHATSTPIDARRIGNALLAVAVVVGVYGATASAATVIEYPVPTGGSFPEHITAGPDGNLWFTEFQGNKIGKITTDGVITEYPIPSANAYPIDITAGPDGNLWFIKGGFPYGVGKITTAGVVTEYPISGFGNSITAGPDGNIWFVETGANKIGKITLGGVVTEYLVPTANSFLQGITSGPDGNVWFTGVQGKNVSKITTDGVITEYPVSRGTISVTAGPDGNIWFTEVDPVQPQFGIMTTDGTLVTEFPGGANGSITDPQDGNIWFTLSCGPNPATFCTDFLLGSVTPQGVITFYPILTANHDLIGVALGADGNVWFTEPQTNKIGKLILAKATAAGSNVTVPVSAKFFHKKARASQTANVDVSFTNVTKAGTTAVIVTSDTTSAIPTSSPQVAAGPSFTRDIGVCSKTKTLGCETDDDCPSGQTCTAYHGYNFDVPTTVQGSGLVTVCSHYPDEETKKPGGNGYVDGTGKPGLPEKALRLLHEEGGTVVDVTLPGYPDTLNNVICGQVSSLTSAAATDGRAAGSNEGGFGVYVNTNMPGGKALEDDCMTEWSVGDPKAGNPTTPKIKKGVWTRPDAVLTCKAGSKNCEGTQPNYCKFRFRICLNVKDDPRLPCTPTDVREFQLLEPELADPPNDDSVIALRILEKLEELPGSNRFDTQVRFDSALTSPVCTNNIEVETVANAAGKLIKLAAFDDNHARKDTNSLKLLCKP